MLLDKRLQICYYVIVPDNDNGKLRKRPFCEFEYR
jgi:hypothetical protein